jgi:thymidylate kinase
MKENLNNNLRGRMMKTGGPHRRAQLVSFSGIDGAGKSTQIGALRAKLEESGARVRLITFWDDVATLTGLREVTGHKVFKGDKGVGSLGAPINRRDKNVRSRLMTAIRLGLYLSDAVSLRRVLKKAVASEADVVICDRYAYDELANLTLRHPAIRAYVRLIMKIVPRPDVSYLLDADPILARARKPEYPLDFLYTSREAYLSLSQLVGGITIIPPMPIPDVQREILSRIANDGFRSRLIPEWEEQPSCDRPAQLPESDAHPAA